MPRVKTGPYTKQRRKKWLRDAKGYWGGRSRLYQTARQAVIHAGTSAYKERRRKKRTFRSLAIIRLGAALKPLETSYSKFIHGLNLSGIVMDRFVLSEMAIHQPEDFAQIVAMSREALAAEAAARAKAGVEA
ncbi:50S ribosomal protein L20 [candidate division WOR-3 bacterium]|nr:50S ribosomal protein L20 [candidate division WOR-3 bacterium]